MDNNKLVKILEDELREKIHNNIEEFYQAMQDNNCVKLINHRHMCQYEFDKGINGYLYSKDYTEQKCLEYLTSIGKEKDIDCAICDNCPKMITVAWDEDDVPLYVERF